MTINEEVDVLKNIPIFSNLETSKLKLLAFTSERLTFEKDSFLFHQGDIGNSAYIILDGQADILIESKNDLMTVATVAKNDIVGEIAILCDVPRTASVKASSTLTTLCISKVLFFKLIKEFPDIAIEIMRELALRLERTTKQYHQAISKKK